MCHICHRLGIVIEEAPPGLIEQENAEQEYLERKESEYDAACLAQGIPLPKAPRKMLQSMPRNNKVVVEPAPSHDGAPTFAAWSISMSLLDADPETEDGYSDAPPKQELEKHRPKFGIRVYVATENATAERAALLARRISELTDEHRMIFCEYRHKDRIEVVALPLPTSMTAEERALQCVAHNKAERAVRLCMDDAALAASWYIMADNLSSYDASGERKQTWVISDLKDSWEEALRNADGLDWSELRKIDQQGAHGHFLAVSYDVASSWYGDEDDEDLEEDRPRPEFFVQEHCLEWLGDAFHRFLFGGLKMFEEHFVAEGVLEMELALARATAAGVEVPRPVVIPYVHEEPDWKKAWRQGNLPYAPYPSRWLADRSFPTSGTICIPSTVTCKAHKVGYESPHAYCKDLASAANASVLQIVARTAELGTDRVNPNRQTEGYTVCLSPPGGSWTNPSPSSTSNAMTTPVE